LGVSAEDVLHRLRDDRHHQSLDRARRLEYAADMISTTPPKPPKSLMAKAQAGRDINRRPAPFLVPGTDGPPICAAPDGSSRSTSAPKKTRRKRSFSRAGRRSRMRARALRC
jgi:hypothetical protein